MDDPHNLAITIMELRSYHRAYQQIEQARESKHLPEPEGEMVDRVHEINWEMMKEDRGGG